MTEERKGEGFLFTSSFLGAIFPVLTVLTFDRLPSLISLAWSCLVSTLFFLVLIVAKRKTHELRNRELWKYSIGVVLFIGVIYYGLEYLALSKTTPGNVSIIGLFEVFTMFVFFNILKKEFFSRAHIAGSLLMIIGACIVLIPGYSGVHTGDLLILLAVCFTPIGNYFQRKARAVASAESVMFLRQLLSVPIIFLAARLLGMHTTFAQVYHELPLLIATGIFLFGISKIFWIEAIHRISITKSSALSSLSPLVTLLCAWIILHQVPTLWQLFSFIPFFFGVLLLTGAFDKKPVVLD